MGSLTSRPSAGVEEVDIASNHAYKYPPRSGNYFGSHFIMGGERFDTPQPEAYLFGENADLNFLGNRPTAFPYPPPQGNEPTKTLKSLVNIRKESLRFVRCQEAVSKSAEVGENEPIPKCTQFNIEFTFDCDARCGITIYYFCTEEITADGVIYTPKDLSMNSETYHYKRGANQQFSQVSHVFDPSRYNDDELVYNLEKETIPIAIHCVVEEGIEEPKQSHTTIAVIDRHSDGTYVLKALKQKLFVDGLCYLLQEVYGIENKNNDNNKATADDDTEDNGSECVICMCDVRDTLILPCRHLCLCNSCADSLRYQANNCPICRAPFRALLQIKALQKSTANGILQPVPAEGNLDNIPPGYEAVSLIEALNGPYTVRSIPPVTSQDLSLPDLPDVDGAAQAAEILNRTNLENTPKSLKQHSSLEDDGAKGTTRQSSDSRSCPTPEFRMSVLLAREMDSIKEQSKSPRSGRHSSRAGSRDKSALRPRDTIRHINEKAAAAAAVAAMDTDECQDEDSEAEKLSPLLDAATSTDPSPQDSPAVCVSATVDIEEVEDCSDDLDIKVDGYAAAFAAPTPITASQCRNNVIRNGPASEGDCGGLVVTGDDSDYYTPEDPATTILSPLHSEKERALSAVSCNTVPSSVESTPGRWIGSREGHLAGIGSLPGTPLSSASHFSNRSSNDSYSSSSSTRQLLASNGGDAVPPSQEKTVPL
ncbi:probable E3 ubiquitin-protein ligase MGRN1 [Thrips palmi]|uniref:RING-type E3 ubiquitin transferase n=1 Tax=Thrips palmi TaxID=161013 RepID=A0A6P9A496_THRPL|nr:probable E3 ubiquitin-protein ligase MGRN1 [Thrips palmi]